MALGVWVFFRLSNNEAELDAGIEVVLTSGFSGSDVCNAPPSAHPFPDRKSYQPPAVSCQLTARGFRASSSVG